MKRIPFGISVFLVYFLQGFIEFNICGTCEYPTQAQAWALLFMWVFMVIVLWNLFLQRAYDAGLESQFHGLWCLVPFAFFWFLFVPTDYHAKRELSDA